MISRERVGTKIIKRHDPARTPHQRALDADILTPATKASLTRPHNTIQPGKLPRRIYTRAAHLERLALAKATSPPRPIKRAFNQRHRPKALGEATNHRSRESSHEAAGSHASGSLRAHGEPTRTSILRGRRPVSA